MRGSVESPFEAQLHETVVIGLNTGDAEIVPIGARWSEVMSSVF